ncbi:MAG: ATP-binding protein [Cyanobacteria bacterium P01_A01_bin.135]
MSHETSCNSPQSSAQWHADDSAVDQGLQGDRLKVLLVEDDEDDYQLVQDLLSDAGESQIQLDWAKTFKGALEMLQQRAHDAYLVDYRLGAENGLELMAEIHATCPAPVIILSGQGDRHLNFEAIKLGASDYLDKADLQSSLLEHYICISIARNNALNALKESEQRYRRLFHQEQMLRRQLAESNAGLEQFALIASHDLREPLRAIAGHVQLLQDDYGEQFDATAKSYMGFVTDGVRRMQALIRDLLDFSRLKGTIIDGTLQVDCNVALQGALNNMQSAIEEFSAVITAQSLPTVSGDMSQLVRLFQNLVDNAIKFRQPDHPPHIDITAEPISSPIKNEIVWQFSLRDNGIGIERPYWSYVFHVFKRLHTHSEVTGTGIGLATCRHIVERHGGNIWLESTPGEGTTVYFTLKSLSALPESNP